MLATVKAALKKTLAAGEPLLIGVSGGADSVALLHALVSLGYRPHVCHLNHRWRGAESDADAVFVRELAGRLSLPATIEARKVAHTEAAARRARQAFFERVAKKTGIHTLLLAHTADDQAETVLLRLIRGAGPVGLAGMLTDRKLGRLRVVRPLLGVTRAEVIAYLKARRLTWREDASNRDVRFLRNRVRHVLLPLLEREFNPGIRAVLCRTAEIMRAEIEKEPVAWQRREIRRQLGRLSFRQVEEMRKRLAGIWPVSMKGTTTVSELGISLTCCAARRGTTGTPHFVRNNDRKVECFDADTLGRTLFVRTWQDGDVFQPLGMKGTKKLQDFFVDGKVPRSERYRIPLLCAADGRIAWVIGHRMADPFKVTEKTRRILRVRVESL